jgi:hypothetical protein
MEGFGGAFHIAGKKAQKREKDGGFLKRIGMTFAEELTEGLLVEPVVQTVKEAAQKPFSKTYKLWNQSKENKNINNIAKNTYQNYNALKDRYDKSKQNGLTDLEFLTQENFDRTRQTLAEQIRQGNYTYTTGQGPNYKTITVTEEMLGEDGQLLDAIARNISKEQAQGDLENFKNLMKEGQDLTTYEDWYKHHQSFNPRAKNWSSALGNFLRGATKSSLDARAHNEIIEDSKYNDILEVRDALNLVRNGLGTQELVNAIDNEDKFMKEFNKFDASVFITTSKEEALRRYIPTEGPFKGQDVVEQGFWVETTDRRTNVTTKKWVGSGDFTEQITNRQIIQFLGNGESMIAGSKMSDQGKQSVRRLIREKFGREGLDYIAAPQQYANQEGFVDTYKDIIQEIYKEKANEANYAEKWTDLQRKQYQAQYTSITNVFAALEVAPDDPRYIDAINAVKESSKRLGGVEAGVILEDLRVTGGAIPLYHIAVFNEEEGKFVPAVDPNATKTDPTTGKDVELTTIDIEIAKAKAEKWKMGKILTLEEERDLRKNATAEEKKPYTGPYGKVAVAPEVGSSEPEIFPDGTMESLVASYNLPSNYRKIPLDKQIANVEDMRNAYRDDFLLAQPILTNTLARQKKARAHNEVLKNRLEEIGLPSTDGDIKKMRKWARDNDEDIIKLLTVDQQIHDYFFKDNSMGLIGLYKQYGASDSLLSGRNRRRASLLDNPQQIAGTGT